MWFVTKQHVLMQYSHMSSTVPPINAFYINCVRTRLLAGSGVNSFQPNSYITEQGIDVFSWLIIDMFPLEPLLKTRNFVTFAIGECYFHETMAEQFAAYCVCALMRQNNTSSSSISEAFHMYNITGTSVMVLQSLWCDWYDRMHIWWSYQCPTGHWFQCLILSSIAEVEVSYFKGLWLSYPNPHKRHLIALPHGPDMRCLMRA